MAGLWQVMAGVSDDNPQMENAYGHIACANTRFSLDQRVLLVNLPFPFCILFPRDNVFTEAGDNLVLAVSQIAVGMIGAVFQIAAGVIGAVSQIVAGVIGAVSLIAAGANSFPN
ncbi:hypothetical protein ACJJTC_004631 [Scirpophaga incertulas]